MKRHSSRQAAGARPATAALRSDGTGGGPEPIMGGGIGEAQLKLITDTIPAFVSYVGTDWHYRFVNRAYERWFGLKAADVYGKHIKDVVGEKLYRTAKPLLKQAFAGQTVSYEAKLQKKAGSFKYVHSEYTPDIAEDGTVRGVVVVAYDITEQKLAEESLRQREERFRTLIEQSADAVQLIDAEGRVTYTSDSIKRVLGYRPEDLQGAEVLPFIHPDDLDRFTKMLMGLLAEPGGQRIIEYRVLDAAGHWAWVEATGVNHLQNPTVKALVANFRNITKRKQVEEQLRASEQRLRFMAESMPQMIFTVAPDGQLTYFSPQWQQYTGIPVEELMRNSQARRDMVHPDDVQGAVDVWKNAFETGAPLEYEYRLRRKDGEYRWFISRVVPMRDDTGDITIWIGSNTDIHDMKQATERRHELEVRTAALTEQRAQLMALNQAKDEFISLASHQLRTPATGVKQYLGMLLQGYAGEITDDQRAFLQTAYESNERQITIVNDLLQVARLDAGKVALHPEKTDIVRLVKSVINEQVAKFSERRQKLVLRTPDDSITARIDADRIRMVLDNIIDNASKYTQHDKTITVSVRATAKRALIAVADQGVGMADNDVERIFQKFSRLENPQSKGIEGSGLGLYWAKKIVDLHGGTIRVRSKVDKGTTFTVSLPI